MSDAPTPSPEAAVPAPVLVPPPPPGSRIVVLDLEATCDSPVQTDPMEIIEIGAVVLDPATWTVVAEFQQHVRPVVHPALTAFCTTLTGIGQATVDAAPTFAQACTAFERWLASKAAPVAWWGSWGRWDLDALAEDAQRHGIAAPLAGVPHVNLRALHNEMHGGRRIPLKGAVAKARLAFQGHHHCGLDDARMTALVMAPLLRERLAQGATPG